MCAEVQILFMHKNEDHSVISLQRFKLLGLGTVWNIAPKENEIKEEGIASNVFQEVIFHKITPFSPLALQMELCRFSFICIFINFTDQVRNKSSRLVRVPTRNRWAFEWSKASSGCLMVFNNFLKFKSTFSIKNYLCDIPKATFQQRSRLRNLFICRFS